MDTRSDDEIAFDQLSEAMKIMRANSQMPNPLDGPLGACGCTIKDGIMWLCEREQKSIKKIGEEFKLRERDPLPGKVVDIFGVSVYITG